MKLLSKLFTLCLLLSNINIAYAETMDDREKPLIGEAHAGFNITTGNSDTQNFKTTLELDHVSLPWDNDLKFESELKRSNGERTREKYALDGETR